MKLARIMGVVGVFLAIFVYGHVLSVRLAVLIFLLAASCLVFLVFIWPNWRRGK
jgi:UDP-N-acetylmuramyl pentapeptide phosphotransferase/UDP-N-acetylglucosamine-1-phosphate transferase